MRKLMMMFCVAGLMATSGCVSYYRVSDIASGKVYYTTNVDRQSSGSVRIKDAATGDEVTIQNSQVRQVNEEEFKTNRAGVK